MKTKPCFRCGKQKPMDRFYRSRKTADGRRSTCKTCIDNPTAKKSYRKASELIEDYRFLRAHFADHYEIAKRIGVAPSYLAEVITAHDCRVLEPAEQACYDRILVCIARGKTFSLHDMPLDADEMGFDFTVAVNIAIRRGLVEPIGKRVHVLSNRGNPVHHYRPVAAELLVAA